MVISKQSRVTCCDLVDASFLTTRISLRNAENSWLASDQPEVNIQATTGSSCSPDINQLDVLLQLYGTRGMALTVSNFGNTLNYALKSEQ